MLKSLPKLLYMTLNVPLRLPKPIWPVSAMRKMWRKARAIQPNRMSVLWKPKLPDCRNYFAKQKAQRHRLSWIVFAQKTVMKRPSPPLLGMILKPRQTVLL